jgi:plastocyanin
MLRTLLIGALVAVAASVPGGATGASAPSLVGVVGPSATISLKNPDGTNVTHLDPGMYVVSIDDRGIEHNFHLFGPGVEQSTDVETTGMTSWNVQLQDGTYTFRCDVHASTMKGTFTVGTVQPPPPPPAKLSGKVTSRLITLKTSAGTRVTSLLENTYKLTVSDSSKTQNFHLTGPGVNRKTGVAATAKKTWTVKLTPGKYTYRSDKNRKLRRTFTVKPKPEPA